MSDPGRVVRETLTLWRQGAPWRLIAEQVGLTSVQVGDLITGKAVSDVAALEIRYGIPLLTDDPTKCRMFGCPKPPHVRRLCIAHISRVRRGYGLFGNVDQSVYRCAICGVTWCGLTAAAKRWLTCGDQACRTAAVVAATKRRSPDPVVAARVEHVIELLKANMQHSEIARTTGLSRPRVSQIAVRNGLRRYRPRGR